MFSNLMCPSVCQSVFESVSLSVCPVQNFETWTITGIIDYSDKNTAKTKHVYLMETKAVLFSAFHLKISIVYTVNNSDMVINNYMWILGRCSGRGLGLHRHMHQIMECVQLMCGKKKSTCVLTSPGKFMTTPIILHVRNGTKCTRLLIMLHKTN